MLKNKLTITPPKILLVLIAVLLLYYLPTTIYNRYFNIKLIPITETATGLDLTVDLPDGSKVLLHKDASIIYTKEFPDDCRKTEFRGGEAFIDIAKDVRPFTLKIKRCLFISNEGSFIIKKLKNSKYDLLVKEGIFILKEYNKEGKIDNVYTVNPGDRVLIGEYAEIK